MEDIRLRLMVVLAKAVMGSMASVVSLDLTVMAIWVDIDVLCRESHPH